MKRILYIVAYTVIICGATSFVSVSGDKGKLIVGFNNCVGDKKMKFDSLIYKNNLNQLFSITNFKYYISNIHLTKVDGSEFISNDYFLINEEGEASKQLSLNNIPAGAYSSISFIVGVDSLHNCSGAQSGALDPANAMFWAWNSGYIFLKIEGKAPSSVSPGHIFEYHIGGYKQPADCIRKVVLNFASNKLNIMPTKTTRLFLNADASEVFKTPSVIDFSKLSSVTDFHNATMIADNYADMFSILKITNEK